MESPKHKLGNGEEIKEKNQSKEVLFILLRMAGKSKSNARIRNPIGRCTIKG